MTIVVKLKKEDGSVKKYERPNTNVMEMESFYDMQEELRKNAPQLKGETAREREEEFNKLDLRKMRVENQNRQIEFIVDLFKSHDAFTVEEFKMGTDSADLAKTMTGIFKQISPEDFPDDKKGSKPEKK